MAYYLFQGSYTPETWAALVKRPQNRSRAVQNLAQELGGSLEGFWLTFGQDDFVGIMRMPNNVNAAALSVAAAAGGAVRSIRTTPLMTPQEGVKVMRRAAKVHYRAPKR
jgi:uncharacterized protein with GYD domain